MEKKCYENRFFWGKRTLKKCCTFSTKKNQKKYGKLVLYVDPRCNGRKMLKKTTFYYFFSYITSSLRPPLKKFQKGVSPNLTRLCVCPLMMFCWPGHHHVCGWCCPSEKKKSFFAIAQGPNCDIATDARWLEERSQEYEGAATGAPPLLK